MGYIKISSDKLNWLREKAEQIYEEGRRKSTFQAENVRKKEARIIEVIIMNSRKGVPHGELAKIIGLDRKNLTPYMERLIARKLIRREAGRQGKYFPTEEAYKDTRLNAYLIAEGYRSSILKEDKAIVLNNREQTYPNYINFTTYTKYFQPKFTENDSIRSTSV